MSGDPCMIVMDDGSTCQRPVHAKNMCGLHYARMRSGVPMGQPFALGTKPITYCSISVCDKPTYARGLCYGHLERDRRGYELNTPIRPVHQTDAEKVKALLAAATPNDDGCWLAKRVGIDGYATSVKDENGRGIKSHRLVYRVINGPIKTGYQIHHSCGNRPCINPEHLVCVTQRENVAEMLTRLSYERRIVALEREVARLRSLVGPSASTFV